MTEEMFNPKSIDAVGDHGAWFDRESATCLLEVEVPQDSCTRRLFLTRKGNFVMEWDDLNGHTGRLTRAGWGNVAAQRRFAMEAGAVGIAVIPHDVARDGLLLALAEAEL